MTKRKILSRTFLILTLLALLCAGIFAPHVEKVEAKPNLLAASNVVISEFRTRGASITNAATDEFIELYNPTNKQIDISGWEIHASDNAGGGTTTPRVVIPSMVLQRGQYYLIANSDYTGLTTPDLTYSTGIDDDGGIALTLANDTPVDQVGMSVGSAYKEGTILPPQSGNVNQSYEREIGGINGNCADTNDNSGDFFLNSGSSNPQNQLNLLVMCTIVTDVSSTSPNGIYVTNDNILVDIKFSDFVTVTGTPTLLLETGVTDSIATYVSGSGTTILTFNYVVAAGDVSGDLDYATINSLSLNGGTITSVTGDASLLLPSPGTTGSLRINKNIIVDNGTPPSVTVNQANTQVDPASSLPINFSVVFSEPIDVATFLPGDITQTGTVAGVTWNIINSGDQMNFTISATSVTGNGTLIPSIAVGTVNDASGQGNIASTSTDNTVTLTLAPTVTPTRTLTPTPSNANVLSVLINEVAWSGTSSSRANDEWIELYNTESVTRNLDQWRLTIDTSSDQSAETSLVAFTSADTILPGNFFLLAHSTSGNMDIFTNVAEDKSFTIALPDTGIVILRLYSSQNDLIDTANNGKGSGWYAGTASSTYNSMERRAGKILDSVSAWQTFAGTPFALNRDGSLVRGTPKRANSVISKTATPVRTPTRTLVPTVVPVGRPIINEFLPRPGFDWNQDGSVDVFDEFIEVKNLGPVDINIGGWRLDDEENKGSNPFTLPSVTLKPGERMVFYGLETNILQSDGGDTIRLLNPGGKVYDSYTYKVAKVEDRSVCRMPDGNGSWYEDCVPTPNFTNSREGTVPSMPDGSGFQSPVCSLPDTLPEPFLIAECRGYGANLWNTRYWDLKGWEGDHFVPENTSKWESFVE